VTWALKLLRHLLSPIIIDAKTLDKDIRSLLFLSNRMPDIDEYPPKVAQLWKGLLEDFLAVALG